MHDLAFWPMGHNNLTRVSNFALSQFSFQLCNDVLKQARFCVRCISQHSLRLLDQVAPISQRVTVHRSTLQTTCAGKRVFEIFDDRSVKFHLSEMAPTDDKRRATGSER